jgi:integrase
VSALRELPAVVRFAGLRDSRHRAAQSARDVADWLAWLRLGGKASRTLDSYEWTVARLLRAFPDKRLDEFTDGDLLQVLQTFPAKSVRTRAAAFVSLFRWAYKTRRIDANPTERLPDFKRFAQPHVEVFTPTEEAALKGLPAPDGQLMTILLEAGLRKSEATHLTGKRLRLGERVILVREGSKGAKDRVVPMTDELAGACEWLLTVEQIGPADHVWPSKPGGGEVLRRDRPIAPTTFHHWWVRCLDAANVEHRKPHTTRHTFATRWRRAGLELDDIQKLLGHASIQTTSDLYVHMEAEEIAGRMKRRLGL